MPTSVFTLIVLACTTRNCCWPFVSRPTAGIFVNSISSGPFKKPKNSLELWQVAFKERLFLPDRRYFTLVPLKCGSVSTLLVHLINKMNISTLLLIAVVIVGSTTAQYYNSPYGPYGYGNRPYGYRPYRPYGGYHGHHGHHHHHHGPEVPYGQYPGQGGPGLANYIQPAGGPVGGGVVPAAPVPAAPTGPAVVPTGALAPGSANAGGAGNGAVQNGQAVGTGTGIANAGPGGFGIGLGIGLAVATPLGNIAIGDGQSASVGK